MATTRRTYLGRSFAGVGSTGVLALLGAVGAACGAGSQSGGAPVSVKEQKGKVVFYTRGGDVETRGQQEILIPTFKQAAPNVNVEHAVFAASAPDETYITKLYAMWSAGEPPDIWGFGGNYFT